MVAEALRSQPRPGMDVEPVIEILAMGLSRGADVLTEVPFSEHAVEVRQQAHMLLFPGLKVRLWSNHSKDLAQQVIAGSLDLALLTGVPETPKLSVLRVEESLFRDRLLPCGAQTQFKIAYAQASRFE